VIVVGVDDDYDDDDGLMLVVVCTSIVFGFGAVVLLVGCSRGVSVSLSKYSTLQYSIQWSVQLSLLLPASLSRLPFLTLSFVSGITYGRSKFLPFGDAFHLGAPHALRSPRKPYYALPGVPWTWKVFLRRHFVTC
jgi:hypothetical protein